MTNALIIEYYAIITCSKPSRIPDLPGVYFFIGANKRFIYIGKAARLRSRLGSYFSSKKDSRIEHMLEEAASVSWQILSSDIESLIKESKLIKKHSPKYNIMLRDDKQYFYAVFNEKATPRLEITHQTKSSKAIGPFTSGSALKTTLRLLRKIFPYCTCKTTHHRPCLNASIGRCFGFCCLRETASKKDISTYKKSVSQIKKILSGKISRVLKNIQKEMIRKAKSSAFEDAIALRKKIEQITSFLKNTNFIAHQSQRSNLEKLSTLLRIKNSIQRIECYDIAHIQGSETVGAMVVFESGEPKKSLYRKFRIRSARPSDDAGALTEMLERRFKHTEWPLPDLVVVDGGKQQYNAIDKIIRQLNSKIQIIALTKNEQHKGDHLYLGELKNSIPIENLDNNLKNLIINIDSEAHRFAISYHRLLRRRVVKKPSMR